MVSDRKKDTDPPPEKFFKKRALTKRKRKKKKTSAWPEGFVLEKDINLAQVAEKPEPIPIIEDKPEKDSHYKNGEDNPGEENGDYNSIQSFEEPDLPTSLENLIKQYGKDDKKGKKNKNF
jgi:hypothetical protein